MSRPLFQSLIARLEVEYDASGITEVILFFSAEMRVKVVELADANGEVLRALEIQSAAECHGESAICRGDAGDFAGRVRCPEESVCENASAIVAGGAYGWSKQVEVIPGLYVETKFIRSSVSSAEVSGDAEVRFQVAGNGGIPSVECLVTISVEAVIDRCELISAEYIRFAVLCISSEAEHEHDGENENKLAHLDTPVV
jgi:hypothetical protein